MMNERTFRDMVALAETYETTGIVPIQAIGGRRFEANPAAGPQAAHADPAVNKAILDATVRLERAMLTARSELGRIYNGLRDHHDQHPDHEALRMVLVVIQQAYELCHDLEQSAKTELRSF